MYFLIAAKAHWIPTNVRKKGKGFARTVSLDSNYQYFGEKSHFTGKNTAMQGILYFPKVKESLKDKTRI